MAVQAEDRNRQRNNLARVATTPVPNEVRVVAAIVLVGLAAVFLLVGGRWWAGLGLLLVPDVSLAGFLLGPQVGSALYNSAHRPLVPALLLVVAWLAHLHPATLVLLAWVGHIAMDRAAGYGLKEVRA